MEQKLPTLIAPRTAWILLAACALFWVLSAAGLFEAPVAAPPGVTFLWMYLNLMLLLASALVAVLAAGILVLRRFPLGSGTRETEDN